MAAYKPMIEVVPDEASKWMFNSPFQVTKAEDLDNKLVLFYTLFKTTNDRKYLKTMVDLSESAAPGLKSSSLVADTQAIQAFFDFNVPMSNSDALNLKTELNILSPEMSADRILAMRTLLQKKGLGNRVPTRDLAFFLEACHDCMPLDLETTSPEEGVDRALRMLEISNRHHNPQAATQNTAIDSDNHQIILQGIRESLKSISTYIYESKDALIAQYGGVHSYSSINDLMDRISNAIDVDSQRAYFGQLGALNAIHHASTNDQPAQMLGELIKLIDQVLSATEG